MFGVDFYKEPRKLIYKKFRNGLYYHLDSSRNILWYYSGSCYLGGWETNVSTEGQKTGLGFEYIPGKYCYLGGFKEGVKWGNGSIKIFSNNPNKPE